MPPECRLCVNRPARHRTSSRFKRRLAKRPSADEVRRSVSEPREAGIKRHEFVIPAQAGIQSTGAELVILDTGFRRYDGD